MKYKDWTLGQVEAVFNKLGGDEGVRGFLSDRQILKPISCWLPWTTVNIGTNSQSSLLERLEKNGVKFGYCLQKLLKDDYKLPIAVPTSINLVKVSGMDLGFAEGVYRDEIYNRAKKIGLELCPPEVGFHLPLQCGKERIGSSSNPVIVSSVMIISDSRGTPHLIVIWHSGSDFWIEALPDDPHNPFSERDTRTSWIFLLPRK